LAENGHRRAFTPAVILFIALPEEKDDIAGKCELRGRTFV